MRRRPKLDAAEFPLEEEEEEEEEECQWELPLTTILADWEDCYWSSGRQGRNVKISGTRGVEEEGELPVPSWSRRGFERGGRPLVVVQVEPLQFLERPITTLRLFQELGVEAPKASLYPNSCRKRSSPPPQGAWLPTQKTNDQSTSALPNEVLETFPRVTGVDAKAARVGGQG